MREILKKEIIWMALGLSLLLLLLLPAIQVEADIGPHPTFRFSYDFSAFSQAPEIKEVILYQCSDPNCLEKEKLWDVPGQGLDCDQDGCYTAILTGREYWQIAVIQPDKTLTSQAFSKQGFYSTYSIVFMDDGIDVVFVSSSEPSVSGVSTTTTVEGKVSRNMDMYMMMAVVFTIIVEIPLACLFLLIFKARFKNILWILLGNALSIPVVWLVLPLLPLQTFTILILTLIVAILIEWVVLGFLGCEKINWIKAGVISLVINLASTAAGLFLGP